MRRFGKVSEGNEASDRRENRPPTIRESETTDRAEKRKIFRVKKTEDSAEFQRKRPDLPDFLLFTTGFPPLHYHCFILKSWQLTLSTGQQIWILQ